MILNNTDLVVMVTVREYRNFWIVTPNFLLAEIDKRIEKLKLDLECLACDKNCR